MAAGGAAEAQARFGHSVKGLLTEKVTSCGTDVIALTKQVLKGSRSAEVSGGERCGARQDGAEGQGRAAPPRLALPLSAPCVPLPAAGPGRQEHGDARGRHPALRRQFKENGHNNHAPAVPAGSDSEECGAVIKPAGPAESLAEMKPS